MLAQHKHNLHGRCDSYFHQPYARMLIPSSSWPLTHLTLIQVDFLCVCVCVCQRLVNTHTDATGMNGSASSKTGPVERETPQIEREPERSPDTFWQALFNAYQSAQRHRVLTL